MGWGISYYETEDGSVSADEFLDSCPSKVAANMLAVLDTVCESSPEVQRRRQVWKAMHGTMSGYYEVRAKGPGGVHYRLFCRLENGTPAELAELGFNEPQIAVINGMSKRNATTFSDAEYKKQVRGLGDDYLATVPRRVAR